MSNTANWSYTNTATIRPAGATDQWGAETWGEEYEIACTWSAFEEEKRASDTNGAELVMKNEVFTEDRRPKYGDMILLNGQTEWDKILRVTEWDMSFFNETPDLKLVTG